MDVEFKPNNMVRLDLNGFYSKLRRDNYNRNFLLWNTHCDRAGLRPVA